MSCFRDSTFDHFDGAYEAMAGCATPVSICVGLPIFNGFFWCWVSSVYAVVAMFTSPLELSAFCVDFKRRALRALAAPILRCTRLEAIWEYPNVVYSVTVQLNTEI